MHTVRPFMICNENTTAKTGGSRSSVGWRRAQAAMVTHGHHGSEHEVVYNVSVVQRNTSFDA
jgi:hypothetical protein